MGTISSAFSIISGALDADQSGLSIIAGNVANANTPGYTREVPNFRENPPVVINGVSYGAGVSETGATSLRDRVLLQRLDQQQQLASASAARLDALNNVQALFTPASGSSASAAGNIGSDISNFFNSFSSLEANPTDNALRQQVLSRASTLAADISGTATALGQQQAALDQQAAAVITQVNALTRAIADLNQQIQSLTTGADAGTLEDQRQLDLSKLSQLIGINQIATENNGLTVTATSGETLLSHGVAHAITAGMVGGSTHFFLGGNDITASLTRGGGQLGGTLTARDQDIPNLLGSLDQLAFAITTEVNAQSQKGVDLNGNPGVALFQQPAPIAGKPVDYGSAVRMSVAIASPNLVAAGAVGQGSGDNSNAIDLANLGTLANPSVLNGLVLPDGTVLAPGQTLLNGQTPSNHYSGLVTSLGSLVAQVQTEETAHSASVTQLQTQNNALSAVNLNDEASALTTLERSYQAASQVFAILNSLMASALNLGSPSTVA
ncbi:flagellar hook-associated protein FlgK [Acidobacteria bacterium AB60]|nr:flagellar hook-associated protein FlgK [Acidobacteria bacterium AB60]